MNRQIIYSRRIMKELLKQGFCPLEMLPNPEYPDFKCWIYEDTDEFHKAFEELTGKKAG